MRKKGKETSVCGCLSHAPPNWGPGLQPRHVSWLGIEPVTLWFPGLSLIYWATPARAWVRYFSCRGHSWLIFHRLLVLKSNFSCFFFGFILNGLRNRKCFLQFCRLRVWDQDPASPGSGEDSCWLAGGAPSLRPNHGSGRCVQGEKGISLSLFLSL